LVEPQAARREDPHESVVALLGELGELDKLGGQLQHLADLHRRQAVI
jgi:hypothetical protein